MQHAAIWHWYLLFCIYIYIFCYSVHSFFVLFKNLVSLNRWSGPLYQRVLALCAFFNRGGTERINSSKILCSMFVYVLLNVNLCAGLI